MRCFKWRLSQKDCLNRGYVLDGYPKSYKFARKLFMKVRELAEDEEMSEPEEEDQEPEPPMVIDDKLKPDTVILLRADKSYMMDFIDNMTEKQVLGTHNNEKDLDRRLRVWKTNNQSDDGSYVRKLSKNRKLKKFGFSTISKNLQQKDPGGLLLAEQDRPDQDPPPNRQEEGLFQIHENFHRKRRKV